jgi:hypothetical protein
MNSTATYTGFKRKCDWSVTPKTLLELSARGRSIYAERAIYWYRTLESICRGNYVETPTDDPAVPN